MLINTNEAEQIRVGPVIAKASITGRDVAQVEVHNVSSKRWVRIFIGVFQGEAVLGHLEYRDLAPKKTYIFKNVPISIVEIQYNEIRRQV